MKRSRRTKGWFADVIGIVVNVVEQFVQEVGKAVAFVLDAAALIGYTLDAFVAQLEGLVVSALGKAVPAEAAKWISTISYLVHTYQRAQPPLGPAFLQALGNALRSGQLPDVAMVLGPAMADSIREANKQAWPKALPLPSHIVALVKPHLDRNATEYVRETVRYTVLNYVDDRDFFYIWSHFKDGVSAIAVERTIVFVDVPDFQDRCDVFTCVHEIKHMLQFRELGVDEFTRRYLHDKARGTTVALEVEADKWACRIVPGCKPGYIGRCP